MKKRYTYSDEDRWLVESLAGMGLPYSNIASLVRDGKGIDKEVLTHEFKTELARGKAKANAEVARSLFQKATEDKDTTALIFWAKTQMRWSEKATQEIDEAPEPKQIIFNIKNARIEST